MGNDSKHVYNCITVALTLHQTTTNCVELCKITIKYNAIFVYVTDDVLGFRFSDDIPFSAYIKNCIFKSCFREGAESKVSAMDVR